MYFVDRISVKSLTRLLKLAHKPCPHGFPARGFCSRCWPSRLPPALTLVQGGKSDQPRRG